MKDETLIREYEIIFKTLRLDSTPQLRRALDLLDQNLAYSRLSPGGPDGLGACLETLRLWRADLIFRNRRPDELIEAFRAQEALKSFPDLKKAGPKNLARAEALLAAWKKSALKDKSIEDLRRAFQLYQREKNVGYDRQAAKEMLRGANPRPGSRLGRFRAASEIVLSWRKEPALKKLSPDDLLAAQDLADSDALLAIMGGRELRDMAEAAKLADHWRKSPLRPKSPELIAREIKVAEQWQKSGSLQKAGPNDIEKARRRLTRELPELKRFLPEASLLFDGERLYWRQPGNNTSWPACSGNEKYWKVKDYSVEAQKRRNEGPLPAGYYMARQDRRETLPWFRWGKPGEWWEIVKNNAPEKVPIYGRLEKHGKFPGGAKAWGDSRVWLAPEPGTETYGRDHLAIHGGDEPGSAGCIDLVDNLHSFMYRFVLYNRDILVEVRYPR